MRVFKFSTRVENLNGSFVSESLLKFLKVQYEIKGKEFNLQIFLHPTMQHICLILSWLVEVTLGSGVNKTKTDRILVLNVRHSLVSLQVLASSDSESSAMK